jgi:hypothetical protein
MAKSKFKKDDKVMVSTRLDHGLFLPAKVTKVSKVLFVNRYDIEFSNGTKSIKVNENILVPFDKKLLKSSIKICKEILSDLQKMHSILMIEEEIYG